MRATSNMGQRGSELYISVDFFCFLTLYIKIKNKMIVAAITLAMWHMIQLRYSLRLLIRVSKWMYLDTKTCLDIFI
jgi:hypothetical protein